jgi:hypothetical protein
MPANHQILSNWLKRANRPFPFCLSRRSHPLSASRAVQRNGPPEPNGKGAQCKDDTSRESSRSSMPRQSIDQERRLAAPYRYRVDQLKAQVNAAEATVSKTHAGVDEGFRDDGAPQRRPGGAYHCHRVVLDHRPVDAQSIRNLFSLPGCVRRPGRPTAEGRPPSSVRYCCRGRRPIRPLSLSAMCVTPLQA